MNLTETVICSSTKVVIPTIWKQNRKEHHKKHRKAGMHFSGNPERESLRKGVQNLPETGSRTYKEQKEFETIDDDIAHLEDGIAALEAEILANATNPGKLNELMREKEKAEHALEEKMNRWVYLNDLAEKIESQKG